MTETLADIAGFQIAWQPDQTLSFPVGIRVDETRARLRDSLRSVALDPDACVPADQVQYWMYNGIAQETDRARLAASGMRYELTLMYPHSLGRERAKTLGHLHSFPEGGQLNYPEVCEVLHGSAWFIFQTMDVARGEASFCAALKAESGDKIVIPPNVHHLTINAGDTPLLFADVIPLAVSGIYAPLAALHGAAWLDTLEAGFIRNPHYQRTAELQYGTKQTLPNDMLPDRPLYAAFTEAPDAFAWLLTPDHFPTLFPDLWEQVAAFV